MKAVILVGGEGTRLRPLTCNTPKAMVPILNRPFLEHVIEHLKAHSIDDIVLALCYLPHRIQSYFGDGRGLGVKLTYAVEGSPLGTAGAVKNVANYLGETFFVLNGDIFTKLDLTSMMAFHRQKGAKLSIALTPVDDPTLYGVVECDAEGRVQSFAEKPSPEAVTSNMINAGIYIIEPEVPRYIPPGHYMFERGLFPSLIQSGEPVYGYPSPAYWIDIGTAQKYLKLHHDLLLAEDAASFLGRPVAERLWFGQGCLIDDTVQIAGPVVIGADCQLGPQVRLYGPAVLGPGCRVGEDAVIEKSILWHNVAVGKRVKLEECIIADNSIIGDDCWVEEGCVLSDGVRIGDGNRLGRGTLMGPGEVREPRATPS